MKTEAECIAEGIREYCYKLTHLLEVANAEGLCVDITLSDGWGNKLDFGAKGSLLVHKIYRTEIL